jgi:hypothetical protein
LPVSYRDSQGIEHAVELEASSLYEAVGPGLTRNTFDEWLHRPGGTPADVALKTRLKALLGVSP